MTATTSPTSEAATSLENGDNTAALALPGHTMRTIVQAEYRSADVLRVEAIERPTTGDNEVLVRVHAAGLDGGTWHMMAGLP
jgi:hypothetical protein